MGPLTLTLSLWERELRLLYLQQYVREQGLRQMLNRVGDVQLGEVCQYG